jgi:hypothetical protein
MQLMIPASTGVHRPHSFRIESLRVPAALLLAFLQRTPAVRAVADVLGDGMESPADSLMKAAAASVAALGAVDSVAGATSYSLSTGSPGHPSPYTVTAGSQIEGVAFALDSMPEVAAPPESWTVTGNIPPGLVFGSPGDTITSAGSVNVSNPTLTGTPTTPGTYSMVLVAWEYTDGMGLFSSSFTYSVVVDSGPTPTPTPISGNAPIFTTEPMSVVTAGGKVALDAVASNSPSYQWMLNSSTPVAGATDSILLLSDAAASVGSYTCVATNAAGTATSTPATVSVGANSNPGHLVNLSARAEVGTGGNIVFGGFAIGPLETAGSLPMLIRASGPAIAAAPFNVPGTIPDPQLQLFNSSNLILQTNDGWMASPAISATAAAVGAFSWGSTASHDAALDVTEATGTYTAQVAGESGDTGVALLEIYDATTAVSFTQSSPHLVNLSARVDVGTGSNVLFAGFVIGGQSALTVLIRASGPAIAAAPFDVPGTLPDPQLTLQDPSTGFVYASNAGWGGDPQIVDVAASVGAFKWNVPTSRDSALLITLPPGSYTAAAAGSGGDTGVAIVEVYEVQ